VGTDKRERQKANRQARLAELEREQRRSTTRKKVIRIGLIVIVALAAAFGLSRLIGEDDSTVDASDSTLTTDATATTVAPSTIPGAAITGETPCPAADGSSERASSFENPPPMCIDPAKTYTATIDTSEGSFTVALDTAKAPNTVNNFVVLSRYHFYDGLTFHRIEPVVIQGGDPNGTGSGGPGYEFADELPSTAADFVYTAGSVAMANSGPNTNGSQFFVTVTDTPFDGPNYSLFGQVTEGFDTTIPALETAGAAGEVPTITSVTITES
jgi:cyclophilin family peptidyl-prolyl cis-trans isomerase